MNTEEQVRQIILENMNNAISENRAMKLAISEDTLPNYLNSSINLANSTYMPTLMYVMLKQNRVNKSFY